MSLCVSSWTTPLHFNHSNLVDFNHPPRLTCPVPTHKVAWENTKVHRIHPCTGVTFGRFKKKKNTWALSDSQPCFKVAHLHQICHLHCINKGRWVTCTKIRFLWSVERTPTYPVSVQGFKDHPGGDCLKGLCRPTGSRSCVNGLRKYPHFICCSDSIAPQHLIARA